MDFLGNWKLKAMLSADENGVRMLGRAELEALGDEDLLKLLAADFIISDTAIDVYYQPTEEEMPMVKEEGLELTDKGVLIDSYPARIENGVLFVDYMKKGVEYAPTWIEDGVLALSGGLIKIQKA